MKYQHQELAQGRWFTLSFPEQMANIGSEIGRTISWKKKKNSDYAKQAFYRGLELLGLTIDDPKNINRLKELCRSYEALVDWHYGNPLYKTTDDQWEKYFLQFNYLARLNR